MTDRARESDNQDGEMTADIRAAVTPNRVRSGTRARLLARAAADAQARGLVSTISMPTIPAPTVAHDAAVLRLPQRRVMPFVTTGLGLALAASAVLAVRLNVERQRTRVALGKSAQQMALMHDSLQTVVAERDTLLATLTGPDVRVVSLHSTDVARQPSAMMFWEQRAGRWTFVAHNLAPLSHGRTYQLWLVTPDRKISAGTFAVSASGSAMMRMSYALDHNSLAAVAVTEEPAGGMPQPTGTIVVVGTFASR